MRVDSVPRVSTNRSWLDGDGRWVAAAIIITYFVCLVTMAGLSGVDVGWIWNAAGVPALPQHFQDLRDIAVGVETFQNADNPWSAETINASVAAYSYTKWWLFAALFGLNVHNYYFFGCILALLFFYCAFYVLGRVSFWEGFLSGLVLVSPTIMTGIERGNGDLLIFVLMALALRQRKSIPQATFIITAAGFLKFYPAAALLAMAGPPWRKTLPWLMAAFVLLSLDVLTSFSDIHQISISILHMQWFSFGSTVLLISLQYLYPDIFDYRSLLIIGGLMLALIIALSIWRRPQLRLQPAWERKVFAFRIGTGLFVGTFILGTNYDYRTMMLIFCLPLLFVLSREKGQSRVPALVTLTLIVLYTNWRLFVFEDPAVFHILDLTFVLKQLLAWGIVAGLTTLLSGGFRWSLPETECESGAASLKNKL